MAADTFGFGSWGKVCRTDPKIYRNGGFVIGFTTSYRMGQLLGLVMTPPEPRGAADLGFMVREFVPAARKALSEGGFERVDNGRAEAGNFLVAHGASLFEVDTDWQVAEPANGIAAVGHGFAYAMGAMLALEALDVEARMARTMQIVQRLDHFVDGAPIMEWTAAA